MRSTGGKGSRGHEATGGNVTVTGYRGGGRNRCRLSHTQKRKSGENYRWATRKVKQGGGVLKGERSGEKLTNHGPRGNPGEWSQVKNLGGGMEKGMEKGKKRKKGITTRSRTGRRRVR